MQDENVVVIREITAFTKVSRVTSTRCVRSEDASEKTLITDRADWGTLLSRAVIGKERAVLSKVRLASIARLSCAKSSLMRTLSAGAKMSGTDRDVITNSRDQLP
jgi:hypothetical protein